jgi:mono/diheme cytochrome c family protein
MQLVVSMHKEKNMKTIWTSLLATASGMMLVFVVTPLMAAGAHTGSHDTATETDTHGHASWAPVPHDYEGFENPVIWTDVSASTRGKVLYEQSCVACHGAEGKGQGPAAVALDHKPADLNKHFHKEDGYSDAYLFWRISEGGTVEPFKSDNSMMPGFKGQMTVDQRWDVLAYIHQEFHDGFKATMPMQEMHDDSAEAMHDDSAEAMHDDSADDHHD